MKWKLHRHPAEELGSEHKSTLTAENESIGVDIDADVNFSGEESIPTARLLVAFKHGDLKARNKFIAELQILVDDYADKHNL